MKNLLRAGALALLAASCVPSALPAQADQFASYADKVDAPTTHWVAVTPSDSSDLPALASGVKYPKALYVGAACDIAMIGMNAPAGATGVIWKSVAPGSIIPARPRRVLATGTTASCPILALY